MEQRTGSGDLFSWQIKFVKVSRTFHVVNLEQGSAIKQYVKKRKKRYVIQQ
jgi:hypothetical protein